MKQVIKSFYIIIVILAVLQFTSCGSSAPDNTLDSDSQDLASLQASLEEKQTELQILQTEIINLEKAIEKIDTTSAVVGKLVTTMPLQKSTFEHFTIVQGALEADDLVAASSEISGRIIELNAEEGTYVKKGQLIARLDLESLNKQIAELKTQLSLAEDVYTRQKRLWDQNIGSEVQYLQAKNNKERLEKSLETAEFQLSKQNIYSPATGVVDQVVSKSGEVVMPGTPIIQILNTSNLKVVADAPENLIGSVQKGDLLEVYFPALDINQKARVTLLGRTIDKANRTFEVEANLLERNSILKPNLLAEIQIKDKVVKDTIVVPIELVQQEVNGNDYIMVKEMDKKGPYAKKYYVETGESYDGNIIITSGLNGDEELIVSGARGLQDKERIEIVSDENTNANG